MKAKFVKENGKIYFRDKNGAMWSEKCIAEVFEMVHKFNQFQELVECYRSERVDDKDFYGDDRGSKEDKEE